MLKLSQLLILSSSRLAPDHVWVRNGLNRLQGFYVGFWVWGGSWKVQFSIILKYHHWNRCSEEDCMPDQDTYLILRECSYCAWLCTEGSYTRLVIDGFHGAWLHQSARVGVCVWCRYVQIQARKGYIEPLPSVPKNSQSERPTVQLPLHVFAL